MPTSDPLLVDALRAEVLGADGLWQQLDVVDETGSTNADLAERFRRGEASGGSVLIADFQSAGRGRQGRTWTAPPGTSIAMSVLITPEAVPESRWTWLPLIAGLAVADGLRAVADVRAVLKWPNDVLVDERKICGVLAERLAGAAGSGCILGMGVNVDLTLEQLPVPTATSLAVINPEIGPVRNQLIGTVLALLELWLGRWAAGADDAMLHAAYTDRCATLGRRVELHLGAGRVVTGVATAIDDDGRLMVATEQGPEAFSAGDVIHLR